MRCFEFSQSDLFSQILDCLAFNMSNWEKHDKFCHTRKGLQTLKLSRTVGCDLHPAEDA